MDLILSALECSHNHECLLCCREIQFCEHKVHPEFEELFTNLFRVFSKYMEWELPPNFNFDFKTDLFPFCKSCILVLVDVNKLDERIRESLKAIESLTIKASGKILLSEPQRSKEVDDGTKNVNNFGRQYNGEKVTFCRNVTLQRYLPDVSVQSPEDTFVLGSETQEQELGVIEPHKSLNQLNVAENGVSNGSNELIVSAKAEVDVYIPEVSCPELIDEPSEDNPFLSADNQDGVYEEDVNEQEDTSFVVATRGFNEEVTDYDQKCKANPDGVSTMTIWNPYADLKTEVDLHQYNYDRECSSEIGIDQTGNTECTLTTELIDTEDYLSDAKNSSASSSAAKDDTYTPKRRQNCKFVKISDSKFEYRGFTFEIENGNFKCKHCSYKGSSKAGINYHIITHHVGGERKARRNRSNIRYVEVSKNQFKYGDNHSYSIVDGRYLCGHCTLRSVSGENVRQHIRRYHMGMELTSRTKINESSDRQYNYVKVGDDYKCGECGFMAKHDVTIRGHFRHKHFYNQSKHVCEVCGKGFRFKSALELHLPVHSKKRPFSCEFCGKAFKCDQSFRNHLKHVHNDEIDISEKKFTCEICGKQCLSNSLLSIHVRKSHSKGSGPSTFTCEICHITLPSYDKTRHMLAHSGNLHKCSECGKKYQSRASLQDHMKSHRGDKNCLCGMCGVQCTSQTSLFKHMKNMHGMNQIAGFPEGTLTRIRSQQEESSD